MKLNQIHVVEFQSILDSGEFEVGEITCLVGKNESGKTALLQALYRLNPIIEGDGKYSVTDDYPRRNVEDYRLAVEAGEGKHARVVKAVFELEEDDVEAVAAIVGHDALRGRTLTLSNGYDDALWFEYPVDDSAALRACEKTCRIRSPN
ncbi:MAG: AAA family ATPase [Nitrospinae bacterium]|nr:AAA family ATPase [Nitrospinota bacterium]